MARQIKNSLFNSLRGRIWVSTSVLAFFICTFGLIAYLVVSLLVQDIFYGIFIPFLFLAFIVVAFGWWLSNEIVGPIDKVTLLSKSLERTSSTSIPKSSGSFETDELLQTLFRNSRQVQVIVTMMDSVANGNLDVSLTPLEGSDRLNASFKKLLAKVAESISAKEDLDKLDTSLDKLKREIAPVRSGNLAVRLSTEDTQTKDISAAVNYLLENLSTIVAMARKDSKDASHIAKRIESNLRGVIQQDESRINEMTQASISLKQVPNLVLQVSENLNNASGTAKTSLEKLRRGNEIAAMNSEAVTKMRRQMREVSKRIQSLTERSQEIGKLASAVQDLANRTGMVALNASIQATELGPQGQGISLVAEEVERLADRASHTNRQIAALSKNIGTDIKKVEHSLEIAGGEIAGFSKYAIESSNLLAEVERHVGQFLNLHQNLLSVSGDRSEESEQAFLTFLNSISESKATVDELKNSSGELADLSNVMNNIQVAVSDYRLMDARLPEAEESAEEDTEPESGVEDLEVEAALEPEGDNEKDIGAGYELQDSDDLVDEINAELEIEAPEMPIEVTISNKPQPVDPDAEGVEIAQYYKKSDLIEEDLLGVARETR